MQAFIFIATKVIIILLMISMGLRLARNSLAIIWHNPRLLIGSIAAAFLVVPASAYLVFQIIPLSFEARAGLFVLAIAPGAPMIGTIAMRRSMCDEQLAASFQVAMAVLVIAFAPLWLFVAGAISGSSYHMDPLAILKQASLVQFAPLLLGLLIHHVRPSPAERLGNAIEKTGMMALAALLVVIVVALAGKIIAITEGWDVVAAGLIAAAAVASGHYLAGADVRARATVATADVQRNIGLALAIVAWNLPGAQGKAALVMIIYAVMAAIIQMAYLKMIERRAAPRASQRS